MKFKGLKYSITLTLLALVLAACNAASGSEAARPADAAGAITEDEAAVTTAADDLVQVGEADLDNQGEAVEPSDNLLAEAVPVEIERDPDVPTLPFPDNSDPALCGIPEVWHNDEPAYLTGVYEGELIQPIVFLYDSHLRRKVQAKAPHGSEIKILLSQSNPDLDYYLVKLVGAEQPNEGWVPAPFVSFEKPPAL